MKKTALQTVKFTAITAIAVTAALVCAGCTGIGNDAWDPSTVFTITFDSQGGSEVASQKINYGHKVTKPDDPEREGYTFNGWIRYENYYGHYNFGDAVTSDMTLYAVWKIPYKVTFDPIGGDVSPEYSYTDINDRLASLPTPTRTNFKFDGWFTTTTGDTAVTTETRFSRNTTIYARWVGVPTPNKTTFTDERDGKTYNKVKIGTQVWMAEDLRYNAGTYSWSGAKCPAGWHLPTDAEWTTLVNYVGGANIAGKKLKSVMGWNNNGNGTDEYGFSALPGGGGDSGGWCSATESSAANAWTRGMRHNNESVGRSSDNKTLLYSVRCVAD